MSSKNVPMATEVETTWTKEPEPVEAVEVHLDMSKSSPIPDTFTIINPCCCAIRCNNCDFPSCLGCKGNCQICCFEQEGFCCKSVKHDNVCCVCFHDTLECVMFNTACKMYRQCFCCEWICGCPLESAYVSTDAVYSSIPTNDGTVNTADIVPCSACLCSVSSCYFNFPQCVSCYEKTTCLCVESESACCKIMLCSENRKKESLCIVFEKSNLFCLWPTTCVKSISQVFCLDSRCAIPCDSEVPLICMPLPFCSCCVSCAPRCSCCASIKSLNTPLSSAPSTQA